MSMPLVGRLCTLVPDWCACGANITYAVAASGVGHSVKLSVAVSSHAVVMMTTRVMVCKRAAAPAQVSSCCTVAASSAWRARSSSVNVAIRDSNHTCTDAMT